ncbi:MAG: prolyl aminopeptidase [Bdellovibrionales bacterium]|nr:prolyl aminopeptidase [Bdellovibrionales bacterium]
MKSLFPEIEPFHRFKLQVSDLHTIHVEECGNPEGQPVVFLHGGPGSGLFAYQRRFFDPKHYRIILFDQRGAGQSTPFAELKENTTWDLVSDIEKIRSKLGIQKWMVFGGSWGSTLALSYAIQHPERVTHLVLRGIFLLRKEEIQWFYQEGASFLFPDVWEEYVAPIPENERKDMVTAYYKRLTSSDAAIQKDAARRWAMWEGKTIHLIPEEETIQNFGSDQVSVSLARIECHYFVNHGFMESDGWLLKNVSKIRHIPTVIVHGRYDVVCAMKNAWDLKKAWPEAKLEIIPDAGHAASEPGIVDALVRATEEFKSARG